MRRKRAAAILAGLLILATLNVVSARPASAAAFSKAASTNLGHSCSIDQDGAAFCWGLNADGQLGNNTTTDSRVPVAVSGGLSFTTIATAALSTCGLTDSGAAYCWGNGSGTGDGTGVVRTSPVAVAGGHTFKSISGGYLTTCAVTTGDAAYCWGNNPFGQLGDGTTSNSLLPVAVSGGLSFTTISVSDEFTCGLATSGAAYCWGNNGMGQFGTGNTTGSLTPVATSGGHSFTSISVGRFHTCAVATSGAGYCWGGNSEGQLGLPGTHTSPALVSGGLSFSSISTGATTSCGLSTSGNIYCWGLGGYWNARGDGSSLDTNTPGLVGGGRTYSSLGSATIYAGTFCGISTGGPLYCWGRNDYGQLGIGNVDPRPAPVQTWLITGSSNSTVAVAVDPSLTFTVSAHAGTCNGVAQSSGASSSGTAVGLGRINSANGVGAQDLAVSTNAASGFTVYARNTGPLGVIDDIADTNAAPGAFPALGTEGFGYTTSDPTLGSGTVDRFTSGGAKWAAMTTNNAEVSAESGSSSSTVCVAFQAGSSPTTPAGTYSTTVIYTALPRF